MGLIMDHLKNMELFISVAESKSFSAGARSQNISSPSATRGINLLEEHLGVKLFTRTTRSLSLTDTGKFYLEECKKIVSLIKQADSMASGIYEAPKGHLRITSSVLFGEHFIIPLLTKFLDRNPGITIDTLFTDRLVNIVNEGVDLAVRLGHLEDSNFIGVKVGKVRKVLCASPEYLQEHGIPQNLNDLKNHKLILARAISPNSEWHFANKRYIRVSSQLETNTMSSAIKAAKEGWGITQALSYQVAPELKSENLKVIMSEYESEPLPINIIYPEGRYSAMKTKALVAYISEALKQNPYLN
jgi:DNA-binding transcriptional LysR family regulator